MSRFIDRMFGREPKESSANTAKDRLQFILVHDRINLAPEQLQAMKQEILAVISKYVLVDTDRVDIALQQRNRNDSLLIAEIPLHKVRETPPESESIRPASTSRPPILLDDEDEEALFEETRPVKAVEKAEADITEKTGTAGDESSSESEDKDENTPD